jgi:hypothetical protein
MQKIHNCVILGIISAFAWKLQMSLRIVGLGRYLKSGPPEYEARVQQRFVARAEVELTDVNWSLMAPGQWRALIIAECYIYLVSVCKFDVKSTE